MQKTTRVTPAIARQIEEASKGSISFEFGETACTEVIIKVDDEFTFKILYRDYSMAVSRLEQVVEYCVSFGSEVNCLGGVEIATITKTFGSEAERESYLKYSLLDGQRESAKLFTKNI